MIKLYQTPQLGSGSDLDNSKKMGI